MSIRLENPASGNAYSVASQYNRDESSLDSSTLKKVAKYLEALQELEADINTGGMNVWLNSPILVQGEGSCIGWLKPVDDFWVFVPDVKEGNRFHEGGVV